RPVDRHEKAGEHVPDPARSIQQGNDRRADDEKRQQRRPGQSGSSASGAASAWLNRPAVAGVIAGLLLVGARRASVLGWFVTAPLLRASLDGAPSRHAGRRSVVLGASFGLTVALAGHGLWLVDAGHDYFHLTPSLAIAASSALVVLAVLHGMMIGLFLGCAARL